MVSISISPLYNPVVLSNFLVQFNHIKEQNAPKVFTVIIFLYHVWALIFSKISKNQNHEDYGMILIT